MNIEEIKLLISIKNLLKENQKNFPQKNLLFLDFDGVINIPIKDYEQYNEEELINLYSFGNKTCMDNLNILCATFDFQIVISSSWRISGLKYCEKYLLESGLNTNIPIIGETKLYGFNKRFYEINDYLINHPDFTNFFILDDLHMGPLHIFALQTNFQEGLSDENLKSY